MRRPTAAGAGASAADAKSFAAGGPGAPGNFFYVGALRCILLHFQKS